MIQSDVAIDHGSSGGPLLDEKGQIVALTVSRAGGGLCGIERGGTRQRIAEAQIERCRRQRQRNCGH